MDESRQEAKKRIYRLASRLWTNLLDEVIARQLTNQEVIAGIISFHASVSTHLLPAIPEEELRDMSNSIHFINEDEVDRIAKEVENDDKEIQELNDKLKEN